MASPSQPPTASSSDASGSVAVTSQPHSDSGKHEGKEQSSDQVSYVDSDTHAQQFCCCRQCCTSGEDKRWYYPWDKGPLYCLPLGCSWCFIGLVFPCCICIPWCRNIICLVQEGAWDGTCFGACICGIPRNGGTGRRRRTISENSD